MSHLARIAFLSMTLSAGIGASKALAIDWLQGAPQKWTQTLADAKREGKVVVAGPEALARPMAEEFKRDTGLELEYLGGNPRDIGARLDREVRAKVLTMDVVLGGGAELLNLYPQGLLAPVKPQFMLPGVLEASNWIGGKTKWMDGEETYFFQGSNWVYCWPVFNADLIPEGSVRSWKDLAGPKFTGKITAYDPRSGGPGQAAAAYVAQQFGTDFLTALYVGQKTVYTRDGRQLVEWVVRGNYAVALGSVQLDIENFRARGIKNLYVPQLEDGPGSIVGGFSVMKQPVGAPHPNAATIFINWYASQPGQTVYSRVMLEPSMRTDVDVPSVPDYTKPKPGLAYLDQYQADWYVNRRPLLEKAISQALGGP